MPAISHATNWISNSYTAPTSFASPYSDTVFPATYNARPIVLSSGASSANYDTGGTETSFSTAATAASTSFATQSGLSLAGFTLNAQLLSVQPVTVFPSGTGNVMRWKIMSQGSLTGASPAQTDVTEMASNSASPVFNYALFATATGCNALNMSNNGKTNSYNSGVNPRPTSFSSTGGNVGTNGNATMVGSATVGGNVATGYSGQGTSCNTASPNGVDTNNGGGYTGQHTVITPPTFPPVVLPGPPNGGYPTGPCTASPACNNSYGTYTMPPGYYGDVGLSNGATIALQAGTYVMNSLYVGGGITVTMPASGAVIIYIVGTPDSYLTGTTPVVNLSNGTVANNGGVPANLQVLYGGTGTIDLGGGTSQYGVTYAPNATVNINNNNDLYGAVVGGTINFAGGAGVHYDQALGHSLMTVPKTLSLEAFSWNSY